MSDEYVPHEAPDGYYVGIVNGKNRRHLVVLEAFNTTALCGVRVYGDSLSTLGWRPDQRCPKCVKLLAKAKG